MKGRRLINIDSEEEGIFTVSCAGGMDGILHIPAVYQETEGVRYTVTVDGLQGGHSGAEIHKEHGNSNILMGQSALLAGRGGEFPDCRAVRRSHGQCDSAQHESGTVCAGGGMSGL